VVWFQTAFKSARVCTGLLFDARFFFVFDFEFEFEFEFELFELHPVLRAFTKFARFLAMFEGCGAIYCIETLFCSNLKARIYKYS